MLFKRILFSGNYYILLLLHIPALDQKPPCPNQDLVPFPAWAQGGGCTQQPPTSLPGGGLAQWGVFVSISTSKGLEHTLNIPSPPRLMQMNNKAIFSWEADSRRLICFPSDLRIRGTWLQDRTVLFAHLGKSRHQVFRVCYSSFEYDLWSPLSPKAQLLLGYFQQPHSNVVYGRRDRH